MRSTALPQNLRYTKQIRQVELGTSDFDLTRQVCALSFSNSSHLLAVAFLPDYKVASNRHLEIKIYDVQTHNKEIALSKDSSSSSPYPQLPNQSYYISNFAWSDDDSILVGFGPSSSPHYLFAWRCSSPSPSPSSSIKIEPFDKKAGECIFPLQYSDGSSPVGVVNFHSALGYTQKNHADSEPFASFSFVPKQSQTKVPSGGEEEQLLIGRGSILVLVSVNKPGNAIHIKKTVSLTGYAVSRISFGSNNSWAYGRNSNSGEKTIAQVICNAQVCFSVDLDYVHDKSDIVNVAPSQKLDFGASTSSVDPRDSIVLQSSNSSNSSSSSSSSSSRFSGGGEEKRTAAILPNSCLTLYDNVEEEKTVLFLKSMMSIGSSAQTSSWRLQFGDDNKSLMMYSPTGLNPVIIFSNVWALSSNNSSSSPVLRRKCYTFFLNRLARNSKYREKEKFVANWGDPNIPLATRCSTAYQNFYSTSVVAYSKSLRYVAIQLGHGVELIETDAACDELWGERKIVFKIAEFGKGRIGKCAVGSIFNIKFLVSKFL